MDNVNADNDVNTGTKRHEPCMHRQWWKLRFYPSDAQKQGVNRCTPQREASVWNTCSQADGGRPTTH